MYPHERSLVTAMKDRPFALVGVNSDKDLAKIRATVKEKKINWRSFQNLPEGASRKISADWSVRGWPTLVVLDAEMRIVYRGHDGEEAIAKVRRLIAELEAKTERGQD
jgi:thioredoxin family protein